MWVLICGDNEGEVHRMEVPGGWLYRVIYYDGSHNQMSVTFVPSA